MKQLIKLINSENLKIYYRKSAWVMMGSLILLVFLSSTASWRMGIVPGQNIWGLVAGQISALYLITIFTVIIAGGIVANEYNWGTIKLLLIRPVNRSRIFLAKFLAMPLFGLLLMSLLFVSAFVVNGFIFLVKNNGADLMYDVVPNKKIWFNSFGGALLLYALRFVEVLIYGSLALMISTVSKSNALTIGVSLLTMLFGPEITNMIHKPWTKYLFFTNLDLTGYLKGNPPLWPGMSLGFSLTVLIAYCVIFYIITYVFFVKRDVLE